jgi:hypothetical protein
LILLRKKPNDEFSKAVSNMFIKLAVVIFGVSIGLLAFFGQKWIEDTNEKIQQANEALGNVDIVQSEYMSDVENIYFINDDNFIPLYESCAIEIELAKKDDNYCMNEVIQSKPMHISALLDATYYFDYEIPDEIIKEFPKKIYEQSFIKRTIKTNLIRAIFDDYHDLLERFSIIKDEVINLRKKSTQIRKELVAQKFSDKAMVTSHSGLIYAHNMCCSVRLLYDESENVAKLASKQAGNLCLVRTEILANIKDETDAFVLLLTKSRLHEIEEHVQRVTAADACKFTPRPRG